MQRADHQQLDFLTAAIPPDVWTLPAELATVDCLLGDPAMVAPLLSQLDPVRGRPSVPAAQVLRLFYLKERCQLSDRDLIREVSDSFHWRKFCHFGVADALPHPSTLTYWRQRLGSEGILAINRAVTARLQADKVVRGRRFRIDSTVTEADIHHPTDSGLLADAIRRVTRRARQLHVFIKAGPVPIRDRARSVKRRILEIGKVLKRRTGEAVAEVRRITEELARIGIAQGRAVAQLIEAAKEQIAVVDQAAAHRVAQVEDALQDLHTVIRQSRAATAGERIPDRMVSVADPDARPIKKGKLGKPVQFGYKVQIMEAEHGFVTEEPTGRRGTGPRLGSPSRPVLGAIRTSSPPIAAMPVPTIKKIAMTATLGPSRFPSGARNRQPASPRSENPLSAGLSVGEPEVKEPLAG